MRRQLQFTDLKEAVAECRELLESGYTRSGNWTLGQICCHLRLTVERNMQGYPRWMTMLGYPLRPILRTVMLPRLLAGKSPNGVKTAEMFVPPENLDDAEQVQLFEQCVSEFIQSDGPLYPHPGFGRMNKHEADQFHAAHTAHHLSFLHPQENRD